MWAITNVKNNHPKKLPHPCQFPIALAERLILSLTNPGDMVIDPYLGVGTTAVAAILHGRRAAGADIQANYLALASERLQQAHQGTLKRWQGKPA